MPFGYPYGAYFAGLHALSDTPNHIDNHVLRALSRLLTCNRVYADEDTQQVKLNDISGQRLKHAYNLGVFIEVMANRWQGLEDVGTDVILNETLDDATGDNLDVFGKIARLAREKVPGAEFDDNVYRAAIKAKIFLNWGQCGEEKITNAIKVLTAPDTILVYEYDPSTFIYTIQGTVLDGSFVYRLIYDGKGEGIAMQIINALRTRPFRFAVSSIPALDAQGGGVAWLTVLKADAPTVTAGAYADGYITVYAGTSAGDVRVIDGSGAQSATPLGVLNPAGTCWRFDVTLNFTAPPDATSDLDLADAFADDAADLAGNALLNQTANGGDVDYLQFADPGGLFAGDFANGQICVFAGTSAGDVRDITAAGLVASGANWLVYVTENFTEIPDATSHFQLVDGGGRIGWYVE